jgi:ABC-type transporter Mla subunit MlaD
MADGSQGFGDLFALLGANNPITAISRNVETFRTGVDTFLASVQTFNRTMETLDEVARRINGLLDEVEGPVKALMPAMTKATAAAQSFVEQLSVPMEKVAPGLERLGQTLMSPAFDVLPTTLDDFLEVLGDLAKRLRPLGQMAEAAGGMFGLKGLSAFRLPTAVPAPKAAAPTRPAAPEPPPARRPPPKKAAPAAKRSPETTKKATATRKSASAPKR